MFSSEWLDIAIGVVLVWFLFAIVVSGLNEMGNRLLGIRSKQLWLALNMLLDGHKSRGVLWNALFMWNYKGRPKDPTATLPEATPATPATPEATPPPAPEAAPPTEPAGDVPPEGAVVAAAEGEVATAPAGLPPPPPAPAAAPTTVETMDLPTPPEKPKVRIETGPVTAALYATTAIQALENHPNEKRRTRINNIPNQVAVQALIELGVRTPTGEQRTIDQFLEQLPLTSPLRAHLATLWAATKGDMIEFREQLERWFDGQMARVSAIYRAQVRWILLAVGIVVAFVGFAFGLRADAIRLVSDLQRDQNLRSYFVSAASGVSPESLAKLGCPPDGVPPAEGGAATTAAAPATTAAAGAATTTSVPDISCQLRGIDKLGAAGLILDESVRELPDTKPTEDLNWFQRIFERKGDVPERLGSLDPTEGDGGRRLFGVVITGVAISFGASFWYNVLRRLVGLRQGGKSAASA